jgi:hypothetical protein
MRKMKRKKMMTRSAWGATMITRQRSTKCRIYSSEKRNLHMGLMSRNRDVTYLIPTLRRKRKRVKNLLEGMDNQRNISIK